MHEMVVLILSWGSIDPTGCRVTSPSLDTVGFFARCIPDLQLLAKACGIISSTIDADKKSLKECQFGFVKTDQFEDMQAMIYDKSGFWPERSYPMLGLFAKRSCWNQITITWAIPTKSAMKK